MITLEITDNIAEVTLNAPEKMNALDETAIKDLGQAYTDAADAGVRALLLRGEGRGFSAGRDISNVDPAVDDAYEYLSNLVTPVLRQMAEFPAPTFAAVQGACLGVGLGLAIATDVVYVAENAKIGSPFANLGATLDSGGHALFRTPRRHRTLDLIYTADLMSGKQAVNKDSSHVGYRPSSCWTSLVKKLPRPPRVPPVPSWPRASWSPKSVTIASACGNR